MMHTPFLFGTLTHIRSPLASISNNQAPGGQSALAGQERLRRPRRPFLGPREASIGSLRQSKLVTGIYQYNPDDVRGQGKIR